MAPPSPPPGAEALGAARRGADDDSTASLVPDHTRSRIHIVRTVVSTDMASSSSYVRYVIESPGLEAQRRYSEFEALRAALVALHPMLLLPPLPDKTSLTAYALQQRQAKTDPATTAKRLRLLERFLQRLDTHPVLRQDVVLRRFLDGRYPWQEIKTSPPLTTLPPSTFTAPPSAPADPDAPAWYASLPLPAGTGSLREPNGRYAASEAFTDKFQTHLASMIEPRNRRLAHRWRDVAHDWDELSDVLTAQSAAEAPALAPAVERAAHAAAATRDAIRAMDADWEARVTEPWHEYTQYGHIVHALLQWRHKKQWQLERAQDMLAEKRARLDALERVEADAARWQRALETGGRSLVVTDTPAHAPASSVYGSAAEAAADDPWAPAPSATEDRTPAPPSRDAPAAREPHAHAAPPRPPPARGLLGTLSDSVSTLLDRDPTRTRHTHIAELQHDVAADLEVINSTIQASLDRFQRLKVADLRTLLLDWARMQRESCAKQLDAWRDTQAALREIPPDAFDGLPDSAWPRG